MNYSVKTLALCLFFLVPALSHAQTDSIFVDSRVSDVNVFFSGAQVTRTASIKALTKGKYVLIFDNLPLEIQPQTVNAQSIDNATIHSVVFEKIRNYKKAKEEDDLVKRIEYQKKKLGNLKAKLANLQREENLIMNNSQFDGKDGITVEEIKKAAIFYRERLGDISNLKISIAGAYDSIILHIQDLSVLVNKYTSQRYFPKGRITMVLESKMNINPVISVSYFVTSARWEPNYDFKVKDLNSPLEIVNRAKIFQSTGEDWDQIQLTLSTGTPQQKVQKPQLIPWNILNPPRYPRQVDKTYPYSSFSMTVLDEESNPVEKAIVTVKQNGKLLFYQMTNGNGRILINPIPPGYYNLEIESYGFSKYNHNVSLTNQRHQDLTLFMTNQFRAMNDENVIAKSDVMVRGSRSNSEVIMVDGIKNMPTRNLSQITATTSGTYNAEEVVLKELEDMEIESFALDMEVSALTNRLSFELKDKYVVNSNGKDHFVEMYTQSIDADFIHYVVPKVETDVYLTATLPEASKLGLSEGVVNIYFEGVYTGSSYLDPKTITDTLIFSLGIDKNVSADRQLSSNKTETSTFGSEKRVKIGYDYLVRNSRKETITLVVQDQIPVSREEKITVELLEKTEARFSNKTGFLDWKFDLLPNSSKELKTEFQVKMPSKTQLSID